MICGKCWIPSDVLSHARMHDSSLRIKSLKSDLNQLIQAYNIPSKPVITYPRPNQAPVKGLKIHSNAYSCASSGCSYACLEKSTLQKHWQSKHHDQLFVDTQERYQHPVFVQSFFSHTYNVYWTVNPTLIDQKSDSLYQAFVEQCLPGFESDIRVDIPNNPRLIPPWLKVCRFHEYLEKYIPDKSIRTKLVQAATHPCHDDKVFGVLHSWIIEYMKLIRDDAIKKVPYTFLKHILSHEER